uniref:Uncharacterized protein n=1 Tax=Magallana gigas TaxID=29159 RepID=K1P754_MAGGI
MITDRLPSTGPISVVNIVIFIQFSTSCLIVLMSILTLRIYDNHQTEKPVSKSWTKFVRLMYILASRKHPSKSKVHPVEEIENLGDEVSRKDDTEDCQRKDKRVDQETPTWKEISRIINKLCFSITFTMLLVQAFVSLCLIFRVF